MSPSRSERIGRPRVPRIQLVFDVALAPRRDLRDLLHRPKYLESVYARNSGSVVVA
jgi:hypothetical protein